MPRSRAPRMSVKANCSPSSCGTRKDKRRSYCRPRELIGRALELERMIQVLFRRRKNNPLLVGEPGVGKTALAEGLALRIHEGHFPEALRTSKVYALDLGALLAG